ncbi:MAG TPA: UDP-N-acetylmuramoyl-L-alanine--D-glutamate ligase [Mesotoga infera]|uniref:UDP-N-acetylmuramoyl-L-alanine--D-glutamate ligase n=1 Tax=Mesotoga infera TaxID=1236046 RepID=UPI001469D2A6|nr:UDP-N-acetylmuramoyl-L-alanine--D-glutamate ligase [Mesotoga infera]MBP8659869.1 UDP-N-acetylmuramoyl-L-alanine--D-glutamate ligase [Mesotoga sp.]NLI05805.1 UDP-N-acetylmuramoyl-L-alanine--D-glutamate ligase [Thermotogaceae bacterium]HNR79967.1 UDP-N-acetylmuramoyl-L-alanine--D-glutamate ligase [Mesotoga infera]HOI34145.1 UDP-N-acetylmuramoyl-L-alanine--D-glutamate ligase [Mesotoga infera]HON26988.1 UDP-N-acetylmuramoyl-L-alanine--D-glutamate ligase [Mesotoga infera]
MLKSKIGFVGLGISNYRLLRVLRKECPSSSFFVSDMGSIEGEALEFLRDSGIEYEDNGHTERLMECGSFIVSPGVSPFSKVGRAILESGKPFTTELEVSLDILKSKPHGVIIGITGTNGKSTTVTMLGHVLAARGKSIFQGGNLGDPLAGILGESLEYYVLEVSSFQLKWFSRSDIRFHLSAVINIGEDHIDYHKTYEDYRQSKLRLVDMTEGFSLLPSCEKEFFEGKPQQGKILPFSMHGETDCCYDLGKFKIGGESFDSGDLPYEGIHNFEDTLVVMTLANLLGMPLRRVFEDLKKYEFLSHRLQFVGEIDGVKYYDDSKATNAHAVVAALKNFNPEKTVLVLGGKAKDETYGELLQLLKGLKSIIVLGSSMKSLIEKMRMSGINFELVGSMEEAVEAGRRNSCSGDSVVLSPAGSSYDLYRNYKERGDHFKSIVKSLAMGN